MIISLPIHGCKVLILVSHHSRISIIKMIGLDSCDEIFIYRIVIHAWMRSLVELLLIFSAESVLMSLAKVYTRPACEISHGCLPALHSIRVHCLIVGSFVICGLQFTTSDVEVSRLGLSRWQHLLQRNWTTFLFKNCHLRKLCLTIERRWVLSKAKVRFLEVIWW